MAQAKKIEVDQLQKALEEPIRRMAKEVARSISEAPDSDIIGGSEHQVRDTMGRLRTEVFERGIQLRIDQAEADFFPAKSLKTLNLKRVKNRSKRQTQVLTVNGEIRPIRRRYTAEVAGADEAEGGEGGEASGRVTLTATPLATDDPDCHSQVTRGVRELMCRLALNADGFDDTADQLSHTAQLQTSKERIRQMVEREGKAVQRAQQHDPLAPAWSAQDCRVDSEDADQLCLPFRPTRVYMGCDGVMAPRVTEQEKIKRREKAVAKRREQRKQASANSSKAKSKPKPLAPRKRGSDQSHKELKLVNTYDQHANHSHVSITSGDHRTAGALMSRDGRKLKFNHAQQRIGLVDGAPWIHSRLCEANLDFDAIGLDFHHFAEHLHQATREVFGDSSEAGDDWAHELLRRIREQGYDAFLDKLTQTYRQHRGAKRKALGKLIEYAAARREMLDYPRFIANRWHIGSGPTEAACKHIPRRLKQSGMRWDRPGTDAITNLAALKHNHQWNTYWNQAA